MKCTSLGVSSLTWESSQWAISPLCDTTKCCFCRDLCLNKHLLKSQVSISELTREKNSVREYGTFHWVTHAEYVRVRLVGSGLGSSPGWGGFLSRSHTRLPSLRKGKESCRGVLGDVSGSDGSAAGEASDFDILTGHWWWWLLFCFVCVASKRLLRWCSRKNWNGGLDLLHGSLCVRNKIPCDAAVSCNKGGTRREKGRRNQATQIMSQLSCSTTIKHNEWMKILD